MKTIKIGED